MLHLMTPQNITDLRLSGQVIYVGLTSMEVAVRMERLDGDGKEGETMMLGWANTSQLKLGIGPPPGFQSLIPTVCKVASPWCAETR